MIKKLKEWWEYKWYSAIGRWLVDIKDWVRFNTWDRTHILNMANKPNGWDWGWKEPDEQLLYANMAIMVQFVENALIFDREELLPYSENRLKEIQEALDKQDTCLADFERQRAELLAIYKWWVYERAANLKLKEEAMEAHCVKYPSKMEFVKEVEGDLYYMNTNPRNKEEDEEFEALWKWDEELYQKDTDMIQRLIALRPGLWT